jgi:hypothetical protein
MNGVPGSFAWRGNRQHRGGEQCRTADPRPVVECVADRDAAPSSPSKRGTRYHAIRKSGRSPAARRSSSRARRPARSVAAPTRASRARDEEHTGRRLHRHAAPCGGHQSPRRSRTRKSRADAQQHVAARVPEAGGEHRDQRRRRVRHVPERGIAPEQRPAERRVVVVAEPVRKRDVQRFRFSELPEKKGASSSSTARFRRAAPPRTMLCSYEVVVEHEGVAETVATSVAAPYFGGEENACTGTARSEWRSPASASRRWRSASRRAPRVAVGGGRAGELREKTRGARSAPP